MTVLRINLALPFELVALAGSAFGQSVLTLDDFVLDETVEPGPIVPVDPAGTDRNTYETGSDFYLEDAERRFGSAERSWRLSEEGYSMHADYWFPKAGFLVLTRSGVTMGMGYTAYQRIGPVVDVVIAVERLTEPVE